MRVSLPVVFFCVALLIVVFLSGAAFASDWIKRRSPAVDVRNEVVDGRAFVIFPAQIRATDGYWTSVTISLSPDVWRSARALLEESEDGLEEATSGR